MPKLRPIIVQDLLSSDRVNVKTGLAFSVAVLLTQKAPLYVGRYWIILYVLLDYIICIVKRQFLGIFRAGHPKIFCPLPDVSMHGCK